MSLFDHDALEIDLFDHYGKDPLTISTPSGRPVATAEPASRRSLTNRGPKAWRIIEDGQTVLTVTDPHRLGRDKFVIEDASGHQFAKATVTSGTGAILLDIEDRTRMKSSPGAGLEPTTQSFRDDVPAAKATWPSEDAGTTRLALNLAPGLPQLHRAALLGAAIILQMLFHKDRRTAYQP